MSYEHKELSGSLFKNLKREKDSHPNSQGSCRIDGKDFWISGWTKTDKNGNPWISLSFKEKDALPIQKGPAAFDGMVEDIPF